MLRKNQRRASQPRTQQKPQGQNQRAHPNQTSQPTPEAVPAAVPAAVDKAEAPAVAAAETTAAPAGASDEQHDEQSTTAEAEEPEGPATNNDTSTRPLAPTSLSPPAAAGRHLEPHAKSPAKPSKRGAKPRGALQRRVPAPPACEAPVTLAARPSTPHRRAVAPAK